MLHVALGHYRWILLLLVRVAPRQRQYIARAFFAYLHRHSHRSLSERFAGALAHRISAVAHGTQQVLWAVITEFWPIGITILVANVLLTRASGWLGLFTGAWSLIFVGVSVLLARRTPPLAHAPSRLSLGHRRGAQPEPALPGVVLSTIAHLDRILVFSRGEVVEEGTHEALLARRGAHYELWQRQSGGLLPETIPTPLGAPPSGVARHSSPETFVF